MEKPKFRAPCRIIIAGQSQSGKTVWCTKLLLNHEQLVEPPFSRIIFCYASYQPIYDELKTVHNVEFIQGIPRDLLDNSENFENACLVIDDQMLNFDREDKFLIQLFTRSRHLNLSTILISQNLFHSGFVTVRRNAQYLVLFPNVSSRAMIKTLGNQLYPEKKNFIYEAFLQATKDPFSPLIIDLNTDTQEELRVLSGILPDQTCYAYQPT